jgi:hypothetical protein
VTSKSLRHLWRPSGGVVARNLALGVIAELPRDATMRQAQHAIDGRIQSTYRLHGADSPVFINEPVERLGVNAVVYSDHHHEAWLFGDCQIMVNGEQTPTLKRGDALLSELRAFTTMALRLRNGHQAGVQVNVSAGASATNPTDDASAAVEAPAAPANTAEPSVHATDDTNDSAREMILPFLRLQTQFANTCGPYGYFVFDGFTDPTYPIETVHIAPGDDVVLASDGYPLLKPTLAESERELQRLRQEDPKLISEYQSTKGFTSGDESFDDRTYLHFIA